MEGELAMKDYLAILKHTVFLARLRGHDKVASEIEKHVTIIEKCPPDKRNAVAAALRILQPKYAPLPGAEEIEKIVTGYPSATRQQTARLLLGEPPVKLAPGLTRAEAHEWLSRHPNLAPSEWLLDHEFAKQDTSGWTGAGGAREPRSAYRGQQPCGLRPDGLGTRTGRDVSSSVKDIQVARWILKTLSNTAKRNALCRERVERGPHGEEIHGSYWDRVDELRPQDLRDSVDETFTRAAMRMQKSLERLLAKKHEPLAPAPAWWKPARCAKILLTAAELMVEGKQMQHCVAGYAGYVKSGGSVIVKLEVPEASRTRSGRGSGDTVWHRSTVELDRRSGRVLQHRGPQNREPHPINVKALNVLLRRWRS